VYLTRQYGLDDRGIAQARLKMRAAAYRLPMATLYAIKSDGLKRQTG
jgi:hypothetical protein